MRHEAKQNPLTTPIWALAACLAITLATAPLSPAKDRDGVLDNGWKETYSRSDGVLTLDGGWTSFNWYGTGPVFATEGPFVFESETPVTLRITDDYVTGDRFLVYDNGVPLEKTTIVEPGRGGPELGGRPAFIADHLSSGIYSLDRGPHELTVQVIENPCRMGRAHMRLDTEYRMPTFAPDDLVSIFDGAGDRLSFAVLYQTLFDGGGIDPLVEDVTIRYGGYLVTIPAGSMVCAGSECLYEAVPPGPEILYIDDQAIVFRGSGLRLCPANNPAGLGIWIGDDRGLVGFRCAGTLRLPE